MKEKKLPFRLAVSDICRIFAAKYGIMGTIITSRGNRSLSTEQIGSKLRNVVEIIDTPLDVVKGRNIIRRVEKILMPNGRYRFPITYIDRTPGFWRASVIEESERKAKELDVSFKL